MRSASIGFLVFVCVSFLTVQGCGRTARAEQFASQTKTSQPHAEDQTAPDATADATELPKQTPSYARADLNPLNDWIVAPPDEIEGCEAELKRLGVRFKSARIPVRTKGEGGFKCGTPQAVRFNAAPNGLRFVRAPRMSCGLALALVGFERVVQEEAKRWLKRKVRRVRHMGTYNCRTMAAFPGWISEHSYANAIDIKSFILSDGRELSVLEHFHAKRPRHKAASQFLHAVAQRLCDEEIFSVVLTPYFDRAHRNHFHLDLARYRTNASRPL